MDTAIADHSLETQWRQCQLNSATHVRIWTQDAGAAIGVMTLRLCEAEVPSKSLLSLTGTLPRGGGVPPDLSVISRFFGDF